MLKVTRRLDDIDKTLGVGSAELRAYLGLSPNYQIFGGQFVYRLRESISMFAEGSIMRRQKDPELDYSVLGGLRWRF